MSSRVCGLLVLAALACGRFPAGVDRRIEDVQRESDLITVGDLTGMWKTGDHYEVRVVPRGPLQGRPPAEIRAHVNTARGLCYPTRSVWFFAQDVEGYETLALLEPTGHRQHGVLYTEVQLRAANLSVPRRWTITVEARGLFWPGPQPNVMGGVQVLEFDELRSELTIER